MADGARIILFDFPAVRYPSFPGASGIRAASIFNGRRQSADLATEKLTPASLIRANREESGSDEVAGQAILKLSGPAGFVRRGEPDEKMA